MTTTFKSVPLVAPGHTRPVTHLSFSPLQDDQSYLLISSCKDGNPMLREWTGDWIGTFIGHKGAVWSSKISRDTSKAASGSADFTAYASSIINLTLFSHFLLPIPLPARSGIPTQGCVSTLSPTIISSEPLPYHQTRLSSSPVAKRKRPGFLTSTGPMPLPTF
jgi:WD40 repeat protein